MAAVRSGQALRILLVVASIVVLLAVLLGVEVYLSATAKPNIDTDYAAKLEELARSVQGEGTNRWEEYVAAVEGAYAALGAFAGGTVESADNWPDFLRKDGAHGVLLTVTDLDSMLIDATEGDGHDPELSAEEEVAALRDASARMSAWLRGPGRGALAPLLTLRDGGGSFFRPWPRGVMLIYVALPELRLCRDSARALSALMAVSADDGDWETYSDSFGAMMWMSAGLSAEPIIISNLVAYAVASVGIDHVQRDAIRQRIPAETLAELRMLMDQHPLTGPAHALRGERLWALDVAQRVHDRRGRLLLSELDEIDSSPDGLPAIANVASIVMPRRKEAEAVLTGFYDQYIDIVEGRMPAGGSNIDDRVEFQSWRHPLSGLLLPAIGSYRSAAQQEMLNRIGLRTILAIEQHRIENGVLPESLESLVPEYIDAVPVDPLAKVEQPLIYRVLAEPDERGVGFVLYSLGLDGTDNGGTAHPQGWFRALRRDGAGTDAVLSRVR